LSSPVPNQQLAEIERRARAVLAPPPNFTVSEWADAERRLSSESSPEPFRWRTARAEYQRGIMDAFSDARNRRVVVCSSSQIGKTSIIENVVGFHVAQDPSPILIVEPTLDMGEAMSKDRLMPMFRDTPALAGKVADPRSRDSGNTLLHKRFPGGHLTLAGANSPASLASRPIRVLLCDEIDRYPASAGPEGNPVKLAIKRTNNFWNRRIGLFSTPTEEGVGIDAEYEASDKRRFFVDCAACGHEQTLRWEQVRYVDDKASTARYACEGCGELFDEAVRDAIVRKGRWKATATFNGVAGFHVNELYSPWRAFADVVTEFLEAKDDRDKLRVWVNTSLGEPWRDRGAVSADDIADDDGAAPQMQIPERVFALTMGVDTQGDRLAYQIVGWGRNGERWVIGYDELPGDPNEDSPWAALTEIRRQVFTHPFGGDIRVGICAIDSGGLHTQKVVAYAREFRSEGVIAVKGASTRQDVMLRTRPSKVDYKANGKVFRKSGEVWIVGTDIAKSALMGQLQVESDRRKVHFAAGLPIEFFRQLTSESYDKRLKRWVKPKKKTRNEALDTHVYAAAATMHPWLRLDIATPAKWGALERKLTIDRLPAPSATPPESAEVRPESTTIAPKAAPSPRRSSSFVKHW
jgi:phage terminase large subunit GpA-like protein